jgi:hypothetical protein
MNKFFVKSSIIAFFAIGIMLSAQSAEGEAMVIDHAPAEWAIKGQALTLRAKVTGGAGGVENVTLYYALFKDAAPFRVAMASSGMDMYVGTIESGVLSGLETLSYYIEAQDKDGAIQETPWYDVAFKDPDAKVEDDTRSPVPAPVAASSGKGKGAPADSSGKEGKSSALTVGLIAGGAVALGAGAYLVSKDDSDSGGGGGGGGDTNSVPAVRTGTYRGTATIITTFGTNEPSVDVNDSASVIIDSNGRVYSDDLFDGADMESTLSGSRFVLSANVTGDRVGTINFNGSFTSDTTIAGSITGSFTEGGVSGGKYTGSFSLAK